MAPKIPAIQCCKTKSFDLQPRRNSLIKINSRHPYTLLARSVDAAGETKYLRRRNQSDVQPTSRPGNSHAQWVIEVSRRYPAICSCGEGYWLRRGDRRWTGRFRRGLEMRGTCVSGELPSDYLGGEICLASCRVRMCATLIV
jgi:hypothetical protein